ncbi:hypothetical protein DFR67_112143 [Williamsia limnetica]|uniref:Serine/threonine protein kinase n=1 Tax=Williamsia limnetica TaxID=882452 RepID=A0A318RXD6_WILLI|nr:hypothetical protein [Williamsia limnetica]PYE14681.1 hypothetical protein DFR67_112143 [Williamsia limnetica]
MTGNYPPTPPKSPWASPVVIGAIVAGAVVLAIAVLLGFLLIPSDEDNATGSNTSTTATPTQQTSTKTITLTPSTGAPTSSLTPTATTPITTPNLPNPNVPGADGQGFLSGPRCNAAGDPAVMIGQTDRSKVVVCQVGNQTGRYYYKGLADGGAIEIQYPTRSGNRFTAVNNSTTYLVDGSSLTISDGGAVLAAEPMIYYWTN